MENYTTTSHGEIRIWIMSRGGSPARLRSTSELCISFGGMEQTRRIGWEDFFREFDEQNLQFQYRMAEQDGSTSRFHRLLIPTH